MRDWDEPVNYSHVWRLQCRMDHLGVESEEPDIFRLCCLSLAFLMLRDEAAILDSLAAEGVQYGGSRIEIFTGVRDGLFAMYQRSLADNLAFWTSGYEADRAALLDAIRRNRLPRTDPDWFEPPHIRNNHSEIQSRTSSVRREIISLLGSRPISKDVRRLIHALPKTT